MAPWNESQHFALFCYATRTCSKDSLITKIRAVDALQKFEEVRQRFSDIATSHAPELEKLFAVPAIANDALRSNEIVAGFITFVLQMIDGEMNSVNFAGAESQIDALRQKLKLPESQIDGLRQKLKFLVSVLGDAPMMRSHKEEVGILVERFRFVANEAGRLIFDMFSGHGSSSDSTVDSTASEDLGNLLNKIDVLINTEIKEHISKFPKLPSCITPDTAGDSLFIVDSLVDDLDDLIKGGVDVVDDLRRHFKTLYLELMALRSLFRDINVPNLSEIEECKEPVKQVRDLAYEAEYIVNSFTVGDIPVWYISIRLPALVDKVKLIRITFEKIKMKSDNGKLEMAEDFAASVSFQVKREPIVENVVVGFDDAAKDILGDLTGGSKNRKSVFIHGMPGLGKTTLAQKVYDDSLTARHFDKRAWCIVSQTYRRRNLLIEILTCLGREDLTKEKISTMEDEELAEQMYKTLKGRRYLVVMDDIWSTVVWDEFQRYLPEEHKGSRVMFTSRNKEMAPRESILVKPPTLSDEQCWELLRLKTFRGDHPCPPDLVDVGENIAKLCRQLPLSIVITGGILANLDRKETAWKKVEKSLESYILDEDNCMKILELSYKHLPDHLKPCFLYFGAFPEDLEIPTWKLISLWIAEGFVQRDGERSTEWIAEKHFFDLIDRSLVLISRTGFSGAIKACRIHDLLRELCLRRAENENFLKLLQGQLLMHEKHHRLCAYPSSPTWSGPFGLHLRSYLGYLWDIFFSFPSLKLLKILDLPDRMLNNNEQARIGLLVHLRYLALACIPSSIGSCEKLEFLYVESDIVVTIPTVLLEMRKLRYLQIETQARFDPRCCLAHMNNLHTLSCVQIYKLEDEEILKHSPHLRKLKCLCEPLSDERLSSGRRCPDLSFLNQLESLKLAFGNGFGGEYAIIGFPKSLKKLSLSNVGLPWKKMSIIGRLPNLVVLKLVSNAFEGQRWQTRDGEFQKLEFLKLDRLKFSRWNVASSEHFPRLKKLAMYKCYNLLRIPSEIGDVSTLERIEAHSCGVHVRNSAAKIKEEHGIKIIITGDVW